MISKLFQTKQANPAATAVNNAGNGHSSVTGDDPFLDDPFQHIATPNQDGKYDGGWVTIKGEVLTFERNVNPFTGKKEDWGHEQLAHLHHLGKSKFDAIDRGNVRWVLDHATNEFGIEAANDSPKTRQLMLKALEMSPPDYKINFDIGPVQEAHTVEEARKAITGSTDDSGATTGLRRQPDYGEKDSYTSEMNEANSKGAVTAHVVEVRPIQGKIAYVTKAEYQDGTLTKFNFSADRQKAMILPPHTAQDMSRQINGPRFKTLAQAIIAAPDYAAMFTPMTTLARSLGMSTMVEPRIKSEIAWAVKHLKKKDRIVWYLRIFRLAFLASWKVVDIDLTQAENNDDQAIQGAVKQWRAILKKYQDDYREKKGDLAKIPDSNSFSSVHQNLEHFYGMPVPEIQNYALSAERSYTDVIAQFQQFEKVWQEQASKLLTPQTEDKIWMQFPDGWAWWYLPRAACSAEAKAMGHCGNEPRAGRTDQKILSLREPKKRGETMYWEPHLTFVLHGTGDSGMLGEMKGRNNDKPVKRYYPYIIALLKDNRIHGFVGATWMKERNFSMQDLTPEQREEIQAANPHITSNLQDYYRKHGFDDYVVQQVKTILELETEVTYDAQSKAFILQKFDSEKAFINTLGTKSAQDAYAFIHRKPGAASTTHTYQSGEDLLHKALDYGDEDVIENLGLSLRNEFPKEMQAWEIENEGFDPSSKDDIESFYQVLSQPYYTGEKAVYPNRPRNNGELDNQHGDKNEYRYRNIKTVNQIRRAYDWGMPNPQLIGEYLDEAVENVLTERNNDSKVVRLDKETYLVTLPQDVALETAIRVQDYETSVPYFDPMYVDMPVGWADWNSENFVDGLNEYFDAPLTFEVEKKKFAPTLFDEPQSEEEAQEKGVRVSSFKNPLFRSAR